MCSKLILYLYSDIVISQSSNVTVCEGRKSIFICILNITIAKNNVTWYQLKDGATEPIRPNVGNPISFSVVNTTTSVLTIRNPKMNHNGFYWIK